MVEGREGTVVAAGGEFRGQGAPAAFGDDGVGVASGVAEEVAEGHPEGDRIVEFGQVPDSTRQASRNDPVSSETKMSHVSYDRINALAAGPDLPDRAP